MSRPTTARAMTKLESEFKLKSIPVPLELDSDSDFNPGPVAKEPSKPKKKRGGRKLKVDLSDADDYGVTRPRKRGGKVLDGGKKATKSRSMATNIRRSVRPDTCHNPLLEFFGDLGLQSASEGVDDGECRTKGEDDESALLDTSEEEYNSDVSRHSDDEDEEPPSGLPRTLAIVAEEMRRKSQSLSASQVFAKAGDAESSVTEPDSDSEPSSTRPNLKRKSPSTDQATLSPSKRRRISPCQAPDGEDPSATEPETDDEPVVTATTKPTISTNTNDDSSVTEPETESDAAPGDGDDSETEPDTESDDGDEDEYDGGSCTGKKKKVNSRPTFPLAPDQTYLGPLVLSPSYAHLSSSSPVPAKLARPRPIQVPASINTHLRDYQRDGVRFFWERYQENRGGLLGDDMGLGKTIQIIAFLSALMSKTGTSRDVNRRRRHVSNLQDSQMWKEKRKVPEGPDERWPTALIVAPSSVVGNWEREFATWGYFEVGTYSTAVSAEDRKTMLKDFKLGRLDVLLTTFDLARRDIDLLDDLPFSCIFVDEAHRVKNPKSKLTESFHRFKCLRRYGVTGTAIQNSYNELWTILDWTTPGAIGTRKQWEGYVAQPLTRGQSKNASEEEKIKAVMVARILKEKFLPKFFLRRTKDLIKAQLPKKTDEVVFCPLGPKQIYVYKRLIASDPVQNLVRKDEWCDCGSRKKRKSCCHPYDKADLFKYMSALIKVSNHLALILPSPTDTADQVARNRALSELAFPEGNVPSYGPAMLIPKYCGKWMILETLLKEWRKDASNKVLIFTKSVKLLEMLEFHLRSKNLGYVKLDGSTKQGDRMPMIDKFHQDPNVFVFLISTLAGGTGLNLTGANKVVIFDPNWNPAHDLQAMDRAYRYGQTRDVSVYRLLGAGSLEELIYARQVYKQQQMAVGYDASLQTRYFEGVQGDKQRQGELFGLKNIFGFNEGTIGTKMAIEKATLVDLDWALANMQAKTSAPRAVSGKAKWVYEAEASSKKEDGELRGLGALLFDDETPDVHAREDDIAKTLRDIGVDYTHRNESLIAENAVEGERIKALLEKKKKALKEARSSKQAAKSQDTKEKAPAVQWPPKRRHHKPAQTPQEKLIARREALIELGIISTSTEVYRFAENFVRMSKEEQQETLDKLDHHARRNPSQR